MNTSEIEVFLAIVRYGNISNAARQLYISQSTISQRIKNLESKLGVRLLERSKGITSIRLTNEGERFFKIALKWEQLSTDSKMLKQKQHNQYVSIAGVDSINNFVLNDIFRSIVNDDPNTGYFFRTHQSNEIYSLVEDNTVDIGFILQEKVSDTVIKEEFFKEELVLVLNRQLSKNETVDLASLDSKKELYINWGHTFRIWHEANFGYEGTLGVEVHTGALINEFLKTEGYWTIIPISMAKHFKDDKDLCIVNFTKDKPYRACYLIHDKNNDSSKNVKHSILKRKQLLEEKIVLQKDGAGHTISDVR